MKRLLIILLTIWPLYTFSQGDINGVWVNSEYVELIKANHSPLTSHKSMKANYISHITFNNMEDVYLGMRFHDSILFKRHDQFLVAPNGDTLFEMTLEEENLLVDNINSGNITKLQRVSTSINDPWKRLILFFTPFTLVGKYEDVWTKKTVIFKDNGDVTGLKDFGMFTIGLDCAVDVNYDYFYVFPPERYTGEFLGWEFKGPRVHVFQFSGRGIKTKKKKVLFKLKQD